MSTIATKTVPVAPAGGYRSVAVTESVSVA